MIRGPISLLIVGSIALVMFLLVAFGPRAFRDYLPESALALLEGQSLQSAFGSAGGGAGGRTAADLLDDGADGLEARGPVAALAGNRPVFISQVLKGHRTRIAKDIPAEITTIRPISGCKPTPPSEAALVGHATAGHSGLELALMTYDDRVLAEAVQVFVNSYRKTGTGLASAGTELAYEAYDVAVTETARPVYLVLLNLHGHRIWNIHLAEGARIERVVLLGGRQAGVANLDPVVPVEVISGEGLAACGLAPAYPLNPGHRFFQVLASGSGTYRQEAEVKLAAMDEAIRAWNIWFRDTFGVSAEATRAGFDRGMVSVVGPEPGEAGPLAVYAPIQGARIRATQDSYFEIRGQGEAASSFAGRVRAIATSFAFGDLTYLRQGVSF
ncbi:hypothetical protein [Rhodobacter calidifons]|uniref:Uncharacterized protein n=1 Tax=Rhodobacter calidifons TaxID=2715277 RepID=A0ABX0G8T2_9RHOB|nr:hypothetical protein [Rhodobacter calidifons]NHB77526.1 hypothetical protein [Rhodobacter calidifons]